VQGFPLLCRVMLFDRELENPPIRSKFKKKKGKRSFSFFLSRNDDDNTKADGEKKNKVPRSLQHTQHKKRQCIT
jgi:nucleosome binding factor SPN SPT16 subunit